MKACGGVEVYVRLFLSSEKDGRDWLASRFVRFITE